jgi:hypothetical protein
MGPRGSSRALASLVMAPAGARGFRTRAERRIFFHTKFTTLSRYAIFSSA